MKLKLPLLNIKRRRHSYRETLRDVCAITVRWRRKALVAQWVQDSERPRQTELVTRCKWHSIECFAVLKCFPLKSCSTCARCRAHKKQRKNRTYTNQLGRFNKGRNACVWLLQYLSRTFMASQHKRASGENFNCLIRRKKRLDRKISCFTQIWRQQEHWNLQLSRS